MLGCDNLIMVVVSYNGIGTTVKLVYQEEQEIKVVNERSFK